MEKLSIFYEEHFETGALVPIWMVVYYGQRKINWNANRFFVPLHAPFRRKMREDFGDEYISFSVFLEDLTRDIIRPNGFLVNIKSMLPRIHALKAAGNDFDHYDIDQFIIQMADIEEIMQMDVSPFYDWRAI
jgi:hypothetical protein